MMAAQKSETPGVVAEGFRDFGTADSVNSPAMPRAAQALQVIDGENKAARYLARLHAQQAGADELAVTVSMLYGATLRGFCRVIEKALGVRS